MSQTQPPKENDSDAFASINNHLSSIMDKLDGTDTDAYQRKIVGIQPLLNPIELAEKRILDQAKQILNSVERLEYLCDRFKTHSGYSPIKSIHRKRAKSSLVKLKEFLVKGAAYREQYLQILADIESGKRKDTGDLAKLGYIHIVEMEFIKRNVIIAFCYEPVTNSYNAEIGNRTWKWMIEGLFVPELRSLGK
jgi:hypothetical protein